MKVFALGLDENQKAERAADEVKDSKIPIETVSSGVSPAIVLAKAPKRRFTGFTCGILSWFVGACCLVLLCLAISEVAYHRQRDQAFLRLKWAELRQRMLGYELLSQQQELDRMALEKQSPVEALPLRRSDDPVKPKIVDIIQGQQQDADARKIVVPSSASSSSEESSHDGGSKPVFSQYESEQNEKFGFLQALMDKIRKHAQSMGLNGDMQVHVVEVRPISGKDSSFEENASLEQSLADGFGEYAMPHQEFNEAYDNDRLTFDRHGMRRPFGPFNRFDAPLYDDYSEQEQQQQQNAQQNFNWNMPPPQFGFQQQPVNWWRQPPMEVQTNQWNGFHAVPIGPSQQFQPQQPVQQPQPQPWYQPYNENQQQVQQIQPLNNGAPQVWQQNDDWMMAKHQEHPEQMPFQPNPTASQWNDQPQQQQQQQNNDFNARMDVISDAVPQANSDGEKSSVVDENVVSPDRMLEPIDDGKFLPIRSDDKPIDAADAHLFQVDDPSSFRR